MEEAQKHPSAVPSLASRCSTVALRLAGGQTLPALPALPSMTMRRTGSRGRLPSIGEDGDGDGAAATAAAAFAPAAAVEAPGRLNCRDTPPVPLPPAASATDWPNAMQPDDGEVPDAAALEEALDSAFERWCGGGADAVLPASPRSPGASGAALPHSLPRIH